MKVEIIQDLEQQSGVYNTSQDIVKNYLVQTCYFCKNEMTLEEGSIISENKWYHKDCFNALNQNSKILGDM